LQNIVPASAHAKRGAAIHRIFALEKDTLSTVRSAGHLLPPLCTAF
jgi:hypothetical protein